MPVEFNSREELHKNPVTDFRGYGTYQQPAGTWSDDTSLALCLAEELINGFDPDAIAKNMLRWYRHNHWTATGVVFDVGLITQRALLRFARGTSYQHCGDSDERSNGNGSLMRILPLLLYIVDLEEEERFQNTSIISSITHAHPWTISCCFYYLEFARLLAAGWDKEKAYAFINERLCRKSPAGFETEPLTRILKGNLHVLQEHQIKSSGYVVDTLEAALWCFLTTNSYKEAVLKAVNLGNDTDTCGSVTGGLAGLYYGKTGIPEIWIEKVARSKDIMVLTLKLNSKF